MLPIIIRNKKGLTILECIIAIFLTTIMLVSLISMQSLSWTGASKADYLGRAQGVLQRELEVQELLIMSGNVTPANVTACLNNEYNSVACGTKGAVFTVNTRKMDNSANITTTCRIIVNVTWPKSKNGIKSSMLAAPQLDF
jgi:hypothetical protein